MISSRLILLLGYPSAVGATDCLVGCLVQGISPFDEDNLAVWDHRSACDSTTVGCEVSTIQYPGSLFQGALWASASGTDGSSACTCSLCDPYLRSDTTSYMSEETSVWSRIHCYIAASEASGYDVSPCVAAIVDTGTLPCVDDVYEAPTVAQLDCEENALADLSDSSSVEECNWDGAVRKAQEMYPATNASSSTASTGEIVNTNSCLVGCLVQGISPFDDENLAVWDNREACDSTTIGCEVSTIEYPGSLFQGALWASSWGTEGSGSCTCNLCDPYLRGDTTDYMLEDKSLWSRIHCYIAAAEASGYDVSPCVAAIVDTGTLPCVDAVYEAPTVAQLDCEENALYDLSDSSSVEECNWDGVVRKAQEMYPTTSASSSTASMGEVVNTNSCLVGCLVQGISPFDDENLAVWENRGTCDSTTIGCEVNTIEYPGSLFQGALWASSWGTEGSGACTCNLCDPYLRGDTTDYMLEDKSLWSRIHCYIAAAEASGYDVSPCVAAIVDTGTLPCVDDPYEAPTVAQLDCEENALADLSDSSSVEECNWDGVVRKAQEMYPATNASSATASTGEILNTSSCLVGCLVQGISPFDNENLAVWDNRGACDSKTIGCEVSTINYPGSLFEGALWASSWGTEGSGACTCNLCDPYFRGDTTDYMLEDKSLWSRIHCYIAAAEASGYDVSPCVAAIVDTGTLPCVDDPYEAPTVAQLDCEENALADLSDSSSVEECNWDGVVRKAREMYPVTSASSSTSSAGEVVNTNSCLVGCLVQGISPFDGESLAVWDNRGACDLTTIGCEVSTIQYPGSLFQGALWASSWGTEGSGACTCNLCDPYLRGDTTDYMLEETSVWSRIHCYIAAAEASGYDVSPCVAAIVDTGTLPCVDAVYEAPTVAQLDCEENALYDLSDSSSVEECNWDGVVRKAREMYPTTSASSSTASTGEVVNTNSCLVGCLVQGISPFDDENLAVWENRGTCDSTTIGCEVSTIQYPGSLFQGALWASSWGTEGSDSCTCDLCDPYLRGDTTSYMAEETSLWSRIHCYLVASEASGYDVSPCVAAIVDTGTLPCVDDVYEAPTVDQFSCEENALAELSVSSSVEQCSWDGVHRSTDELYGGTRAPSPLPGSTSAPVSSTRDTAVGDVTTPSPAHISIVTPQPSTATLPPDPTPSVPSVTFPPRAGAVSPEPTPEATSVTSPPTSSGSTPPVEVEGGGSCAGGSTCADNLCCHPEHNTCGRKYTFCQQRDFSGGPRCCSGAYGDSSLSNACSEDSICDKPDGLTKAELAGVWIGIVTGVIAIVVAFWQGYEKCTGRR